MLKAVVVTAESTPPHCHVFHRVVVANLVPSQTPLFGESCACGAVRLSPSVDHILRTLEEDILRRSRKTETHHEPGYGYGV